MKNTASWVELNIPAFIHNISQYRNFIPPTTKLGLVVKANAYGHGMELIARAAEQIPAVDMLFTVSVSEALALRNMGITKPITVLSFFDHPIAPAIEQNIELVAADLRTAEHISQVAKNVGVPAQVHIKVDTGLSRLGIHHEQAGHEIGRVAQLPHLEINGLFTHFADAESDDLSFAKLQHERFVQAVEKVRAMGINPTYIHTSSSAASTALQSVGNLARLGLGAYGLWPSIENRVLARHTISNFDLHPVLTWKCAIVQIKSVPAGSFVGYDRTHQVPRDTNLAILPVGYWDGFDRGLSNCGQVLIRGKLAPVLAPVIGRVAMNMTMVDVTDIAGVTPEDEVVLLGPYQGVRAEDMAARIGTINYEVTTRINPLIGRLPKMG